MLIPTGHENMKGRRWPVITIALIAINFVAFFGTHWRIESEDAKTAEVRTHILLLSAMHPELVETTDEQELVNHFREKYPDMWKRVASPGREVVDRWDVHIRMMEDPKDLQQEMDSLGQQYFDLQQDSILPRYAFVPAHPAPISYLTANFLHGGWLHIIGNMWFLWLAGVILEDTWGRLIYPAFYLIAGVLAFQVHAMVSVGSFTPTLGASGAIAGLMGAFLVRFPTTKIEMGWLLFYRFYRFKMAAYWLLPLWLLTEILY